MQNFNRQPLIKIITLGCRLNQIESESIAKSFTDKKIMVSMDTVSSTTPEDNDCPLCIINTCTVTQKAEQKARRLIRLLLKKNPNASVLITGCYAQLAPEELKKINRKICVIGGQVKSRIVEIPDMLLEDFNLNWNSEDFAKKINKLGLQPQQKNDFPENSFKLSATSFIAHSRASLKIQDGCNNSCSYCAIHKARGHSVSLDVKTAVERVMELEKAGQNEVVLTTVNIAQYRSEYKGQIYNFTKLLKILLENTTTINFRISSLYPEIVNDEFCKVIKNPRVRPHFHISVQSGSNKILGLMKRAYKAEDVIQACKKILSVKPDSFLACDIITGFPGESDDDFNQTMDLCNLCNFAWVHAFPYSERPGTEAILLKNKVPQSVSGNRAEKITSWAIEQKIKYIKNFVGKELDAVVETSRKPLVLKVNGEKTIYHAMTENFIHCEIICEEVIKPNTQVKVMIMEPLEERIIKGGEIEASAKFFK